MSKLLNIQIIKIIKHYTFIHKNIIFFIFYIYNLVKKLIFHLLILFVKLMFLCIITLYNIILKNSIKRNMHFKI